MSQKLYARITAFIFLIIALLHVGRVLFGWQAVFQGREVPMWVSWILLVVTAFLAYQGFRLGK